MNNHPCPACINSSKNKNNVYHSNEYGATKDGVSLYEAEYRQSSSLSQTVYIVTNKMNTGWGKWNYTYAK